MDDTLGIGSILVFIDQRVQRDAHTSDPQRTTFLGAGEGPDRNESLDS